MLTRGRYFFCRMIGNGISASGKVGLSRRPANPADQPGVGQHSFFEHFAKAWIVLVFVRPDLRSGLGRRQAETTFKTYSSTIQNVQPYSC
jgi:hypothetical protein